MNQKNDNLQEASQEEKAKAEADAKYTEKLNYFAQHLTPIVVMTTQEAKIAKEKEALDGAIKDVVGDKPLPKRTHKPMGKLARSDRPR